MNANEPAQAAWAEYDRSLDRLVSSDAPVNERIRQAFAAGYDAGGRAREMWRPAADQPGWSKDGRYKAYTIEESTADDIAWRRAIEAASGENSKAEQAAFKEAWGDGVNRISRDASGATTLNGVPQRDGWSEG